MSDVTLLLRLNFFSDYVQVPHDSFGYESYSCQGWPYFLEGYIGGPEYIFVQFVEGTIIEIYPLSYCHWQYLIISDILVDDIKSKNSFRLNTQKFNKNSVEFLSGISLITWRLLVKNHSN